ncbi:roadblock/LC7 domain-containing protein [Streptomyces collinus]|uniref:roadblock/LC7 domain-containing protein n=1 Tax=Streptomyces collinus TaxID=42684 RepID=UPI0036B49513
MTYDPTQIEADASVTAAAPGVDARKQMGGLLTDFVAQVRGVTHALLISRDGLSLADSEVHKDAADKWAATLGSLASLCESIPGPMGGSKGLKLAVVEREDALIFASIAGTSAAFPNNPGNRSGVVDTVLAVIAEPEADAGAVGYEMGVLVDRFAPYMVEPVRSA